MERWEGPAKGTVECTIFLLVHLTYLPLLDQAPVATSQLSTSAGVAGIYNVACLPQARRPGIGAAVTLAPLLAAREMGYQVGILQASSMRYNVYRRLGFQDFGKLSVYLWEQGTGDETGFPANKPSTSQTFHNPVRQL